MPKLTMEISLDFPYDILGHLLQNLYPYFNIIPTAEEITILLSSHIEDILHEHLFTPVKIENMTFSQYNEEEYKKHNKIK